MQQILEQSQKREKEEEKEGEREKGRVYKDNKNDLKKRLKIFTILYILRNII